MHDDLLNLMEYLEDNHFLRLSSNNYRILFKQGKQLVCLV
jgi:hypothetical protein